MVDPQKRKVSTLKKYSLMKDRDSSLNVLLINYRYFISGGPERYLFNFIEMLEEKGHKIIPFSVKHPKNRPTKYSQFFLSPIAYNKDSVYFNQIRKNPKILFKLLDRSFYSLEAKNKIKNILNNFNINIAYVLQFLRWISPSIILELYKNHIPIIVRLSDFGYICPEAHMLKNNKICDLCTKGNFWHSVKYRCVQNSFLLSFINLLSIFLHKQLRIWDKIDAFICPSSFILEKMVQSGFEKQKLFHIPTFIDSKKILPKFEPGNYMLYFGRISHEKGINILLDAFEKLKRKNSKASVPLYIVGKLYGREAERLKTRVYSNSNKNIEILGAFKKSQLYQIIRNAAFIIVPSICYENMPNVVLESFSLGKPVIGSRIGSIPELVKHEETGLLFEPANSDDLAEKMQWIIEHPKECIKMGKNARKLVENKYNPELHYKKIIDVYKYVIQNSK